MQPLRTGAGDKRPPVNDPTTQQLLDTLTESWREVASRSASAFNDGQLLADGIGEPGIWLLIGVPGAGKTTFARAAGGAGRDAVLLGEIRSRGGWSWSDPEFLTTAYDLAFARMEASLRTGSVLDSTGLYPSARTRALELGRRQDVPVHAVVLATDPETAWQRTLLRGWDDPHLFFRFLGLICRYLGELPDEDGWASRHWLDGAEQERLIRAWSQVADAAEG